MSHYSDKFSFALPIGPVINAAFVPDLVVRLKDAIGIGREGMIGLAFEIINDGETASIEVRSDDAGDADHAIELVLACSSAFDLRGRWGFCWSRTSARPIINAYGGGCCAIDLSRRQVLERFDTFDWLRGKIDTTGPATGLFRSARQIGVASRGLTRY